MKNKYGFICFFLVIMVFMVWKYYDVNKDIPRKYYLQDYKLNENIKLKDMKLNLNSVNVISKTQEGDDYLYVTCKITLKDLKESTINIKDILILLRFYSNVGVGIKQCRFESINKDIEDIKKEILEKQRCDFEITYVCDNFRTQDIKNDKIVRIYLPRELYSDEVKKYYNEGKLYSKYIDLGVIQ